MGRTPILPGLILLATLAACSPDEHPVVVGSKNFAEQVLLGEIIAQHLEHRLGRPIRRKLNLGGTMLAHQALLKGDIDLYPEYTGTALTAVLDHPPIRDAAEVLQRVRRDYDHRFGVRWLAPLGFENTFAMVVRREDATAHHLVTLSDAARHEAGWRLGVGYEFQQRPDGLAALLGTYDLPLAGPPKTMDLGLIYRALEQGQVNMVAGNSTDGLLSVLDVVRLRDDRHCFPPYEAAIAVRKDSLQRIPRLEDALTELSGTLTEATMRRLNQQVIVQHGRVTDVAREFLKELDGGS